MGLFDNFYRLIWTIYEQLKIILLFFPLLHLKKSKIKKMITIINLIVYNCDCNYKHEMKMKMFLSFFKVKSFQQRLCMNKLKWLSKYLCLNDQVDYSENGFIIFGIFMFIWGHYLANRKKNRKNKIICFKHFRKNECLQYNCDKCNFLLCSYIWLKQNLSKSATFFTKLI